MEKNRQASELGDQIIAAINQRLDKIEQHLDRHKNEIATVLAEISTFFGATIARLDSLELEGAKRAPRTERKTGGTQAPAVANDADPCSKIINSLHFFRWSWNNDEKFREQYLTPDTKAALEADDKIAKTTNELKRRAAEGAFVWKNRLTAQERREIQMAFESWRDARIKRSLEPLEVDNSKK